MRGALLVISCVVRFQQMPFEYFKFLRNLQAKRVILPIFAMNLMTLVNSRVTGKVTDVLKIKVLVKPP